MIEKTRILKILKICAMRAVALVLLAFVAGLSPALAAKAPSVFEIRNVRVDVTARAVSTAKDLAIQQGQRQALQLLFRKIVMDSDLPKIPTLDDNWVNDLVSGLEFNNERSSGVRYIADLTVSFNKDGVYNLLKRLGIPFSETPAKVMLFLPLQRYAGTTTLWSDQNWWSEAWGRTDTANRLVGFVSLSGDPSDHSLINAQQAFKVDPASLGAVAKKYGVESVLIAMASITQNFTSGAYQVHIDAAKWPQSGPSTKVDVQGAENEPLETLLDRSAVALTKRLADDWKQQTLIYFGEIYQLAVHAPLNGMDDWFTLKDRLSNVGAIRKTELNGLSVDQAELTLSYSGESRQLALALAQTNVDLVEENGSWQLRLKRATGLE